MLAGNNNLVQAARAVLAMGPKALVVKHGEYGATLSVELRRQRTASLRSGASAEERVAIGMNLQGASAALEEVVDPPARATALPWIFGYWPTA